jgi:hypothetical protein
MTAREQNLDLSIQNEQRGRTWYSSHSPAPILHSSDYEVSHYYEFISELRPSSQIQQTTLLLITAKENQTADGYKGTVS